MKRKGFFIAISLVALTLVMATFLDYLRPVASTTDQIERVRHFQGITEYQLKSNGLTVLLLPESSVSTTTVNMTYRVGSANERIGHTGMAHLLEHMVFRGNANLQDAMSEFSKRGLSANGSTSADKTTYYANFHADPSLLDWYLRWQADAMTTTILQPEVLEKEKIVVRNELEQNETNNQTILFNQVLKTAFQTHSYGNSTLKTRSDLLNVTAAELESFYKTFYQPDNAVLIIAGAFDVDDTLEKIATIFGTIPQPERKLPPPQTPEAVQEGERSITVRRVGGTPLAMALYHGPSAADPDTSALLLATQMLGHRTSGRLNWDLVDSGLAATVDNMFMMTKEPGALLFMVEVAPEQSAEHVQRQLHTTLESVADQPFSENELAIAKRIWSTDWTELERDPQRMAMALANTSALGDWRLLFQQHDWITELPLQNVQLAAERYLIAANRTEGLYLPTEHPISPPQVPVIDLESQLSAYVSEPNPSSQSSTTFEATIANINAHTTLKRFDHKNGKVSIALLPKPSTGQQVQAHIMLQFGDVESLKGKRAVATVAVDLLSSGNEAMPYQTLEDKFAQLKSTYQVGGGNSTVNLILRSHHDTLDAALHLAFHVLKTPSYPQDQINEWINASIAQASNAMNNPEAVAHNTWQQLHNVVDSADIRYSPSFEEIRTAVQAVTRADVVKFHDEFYGANNVLVAIVGDFDAETATTAILQELTDWQPGKVFTPIPREHHPIAPREIMHQMPDKTNATMVAALTLPMRATDPDYPALLAANIILGDSHHSRLWKRIRDIEGLTYGINTYIKVDNRHTDAEWGIVTNFAPENKERIQQLVFDEVSQALKNGFTQEELDTTKRAAIKNIKLALSYDDAITDMWMLALSNNQDNLNSEAELLDKIQSLTLQEVNHVFQKHVRPTQIVRIYAGDFDQAHATVNKPATTAWH